MYIYIYIKSTENMQVLSWYFTKHSNVDHIGNQIFSEINFIITDTAKHKVLCTLFFMLAV